MNVNQARNSSRSFYLAHDRCMEQQPLSSEQVQVLLVPAVVCAAFSVELGFKALILANQSAAKKHHALDKLFEILPVHLQQEIVTTVGAARPEFDRSLGLVAKAFVDWRYIYEKTEDVRLDLKFLKKLADATQHLLASRQPKACNG